MLGCTFLPEDKLGIRVLRAMYLGAFLGMHLYNKNFSRTHAPRISCNFEKSTFSPAIILLRNAVGNNSVAVSGGHPLQVRSYKKFVIRSMTNSAVIGTSLYQRLPRGFSVSLNHARAKAAPAIIGYRTFNPRYAVVETVPHPCHGDVKSR